MTRNVSQFAGKPPALEMLLNVPKLITAYYTEVPDPAITVQRVLFGTSGHRGSAFKKTFNEWHILAITQAICLYRQSHQIDGPLFLGMDTHAISMPAFASAMEVLAANHVEVMIADDKDGYTPTPVISQAILTYNRGRKAHFADGIVITPSHNPPQDGGFKYDPPNGGPANLEVTSWIEKKANEILENKLSDVKRLTYEKALQANTTHRFDYLHHYVNDLENVINMKIISDSTLRLGVDPLGGAGMHYWEPIAERYKLNLIVTNKIIDPTFRFMSVDWDGKIRMNPASPYAMAHIIAEKDRFDLTLACDTDHDRHGIVTRQSGLIPTNHYLSVAIRYLFQHRPQWSAAKKIGKTIVTTQMMDKVAAKLQRTIYEVPVGFKWFVDGLYDGSISFCGEESAGAVFARIDGNVWTTDKDGITAALLAAEITAALNHDIGALYQALENEFGKMYFTHDNVTATPAQKNKVRNISSQQITCTELADSKIEKILTHAPGNDAPIGGVKIMTQNGWCAMRPSGTEDIYEIYAESFRDEKHLQRLLDEAHSIVDKIIQE